jgi:hypothetical protein
MVPISAGGVKPVAAPERLKINSKRGYGGAYGRLGEPVHGRGQAEVAMILHMHIMGALL